EIRHMKRSKGGSDPLRIHEELTLSIHRIITTRLRIERKLLGFLLLALPLGCSHERYGYREGLAQRILPPGNIDIHEELPTSRKPAQETPGGSPARLGQPKAADDTDAKEGKQPDPT